VRDARLFELFTLGHEPKTGIEAERVCLRVQAHRCAAALASDRQQLLEYRPAHAAATPRLEHGHSADIAIALEPACADRFSVRGDREHMIRVFVFGVPFQLFGDALLVYEDAPPDVNEIVTSYVPRDTLNAEGIRSRLAHRAILSGRERAMRASGERA
jgi:hypothetical protein